MNKIFNKSLIKPVYIILVILIIIISFALNITSAINQSQTTDEGVHITAGYSYLKYNDFKINPEHPPLIKIISAVPLLFLDLNFPDNSSYWEEEEQWGLAKKFLYESGNNADLIILLSRIPIILLTTLLGIIIFLWTKKLFGKKASIVSLILISFSPMFLSHGHYVTTDLGLALTFILALFYFNKFLEKPKLLNIVIFGIFTTIALLVKFSAVILLPIFPVLYILKRWHQSKGNKKNTSFSKFVILILISAIIFSLFTFIIYGFEIKKPKNDADIVKYFDSGEIPSNQFTLWLADKSIPAFSYFKGLIHVQQHSKWGHYAYLLGEFDKYGGWWYYFPIAFLVKTPMAVLILLLASIIILFKTLILKSKKILSEKNKINCFSKIKIIYKKIPFIYYLLIIPPVFYFVFSLTSNLNLGARHLMPIYPFIYIIIASTIYNIKFKKHKINLIYNILILLIIFIYIFTCFFTWPHYLSYFSEIIGGSGNGHKYLSDSNLDWGQDLKNLKKYTDKNNIDEIYTRVSGWAGPEYYNIPAKDLPDNNEIIYQPDFNGYVAISISYLMQEHRDYSWLWKYQPIDHIGHSIYIYNIK